MMTNMIEQHYNHPSVILWGLGNENDWPNDFPEFDKQKIRNYMSEVNTLAHQLDPTRKTSIRRCDFCKDIPDVYSPSIWAGWYRGQYTDYKAATEEEYKKTKHFLHAEWGGDSHAGRFDENPDRGLVEVSSSKSVDERAGDASLYGGAARASKDGNWSESYIANLFEWHLKEQETMPWLTGSAFWIFKDFSTPVRPENPVPYMNQKGVVERDLTPKESYYIFQSYWTEPLMARIFGHSWPIRWGEKGEKKMIKVYSNAEQAELFLNGKSLGIKKRNSQDFPAAGLRWEAIFEEGENTLKVVAKKKGEMVVDEIKQQYQTAKWGKPAKFMVKEVQQNTDGSAWVEVQLVDSNNVPCLDSREYITFDITGDGSLLKDQGTARGSSYVQAYNGRAMIKVNKNGGTSIVSIKSAGIPTAFVNVK